MMTAITRKARISKKTFLTNENVRFYQMTSVGDGAIEIKTYCFRQIGYGEWTNPKRQLMSDLLMLSPHYLIILSHVFLSLNVTKAVPDVFGRLLSELNYFNALFCCLSS